MTTRISASVVAAVAVWSVACTADPAPTVDDSRLNLLVERHSATVGDSIRVEVDLFLSTGDNAGEGRVVDFRADRGMFSPEAVGAVSRRTGVNGTVVVYYKASGEAGQTTLTARSGDAVATDTIAIVALSPSIR